MVTPRASCGITTRYDDDPLTVAASDDRAARLDEVQYGAANGPCMEAMSTGEVVEVHDQSTDDRWCCYRERAATAVALARRHSTLSEATRQMEGALRSRSTARRARTRSRGGARTIPPHLDSPTLRG